MSNIFLSHLLCICYHPCIYPLVLCFRVFLYFEKRKAFFCSLCSCVWWNHDQNGVNHELLHTKLIMKTLKDKIMNEHNNQQQKIIMENKSSLIWFSMCERINTLRITNV